MPVCPHCGEESNGRKFFEQVWESDHLGYEEGVLIVCPNCDVVLGGGTAAADAAAP